MKTKTPSKSNPKPSGETAFTVSFDKVSMKKVDTLVAFDKSDRRKVIRKCVDYSFENPQDALRPRIS